MAENGITYVGRLINNERMPIEFGVARSGTHVLKCVIAEDHQERNDRAAKQYQDPSKAATDYVRTTTTWHRLTVFNELADELAQDPGFNHMALIDVSNVQYREEDPWEDRQGTKRAGRPETAGKNSYVGVFEKNGTRFDARDENYGAIWDGQAEIPALKGGGGGGGGQGGREIRDDEGF